MPGDDAALEDSFGGRRPAGDLEVFVAEQPDRLDRNTGIGADPVDVARVQGEANLDAGLARVGRQFDVFDETDGDAVEFDRGTPLESRDVDEAGPVAGVADEHLSPVSDEKNRHADQDQGGDDQQPDSEVAFGVVTHG